MRPLSQKKVKKFPNIMGEFTYGRRERHILNSICEGVKTQKKYIGSAFVSSS